MKIEYIVSSCNKGEENTDVRRELFTATEFRKAMLTYNNIEEKTEMEVRLDVRIVDKEIDTFNMLCRGPELDLPF